MKALTVPMPAAPSARPILFTNHPDQATAQKQNHARPLVPIVGEALGDGTC